MLIKEPSTNEEILLAKAGELLATDTISPESVFLAFKLHYNGEFKEKATILLLDQFNGKRSFFDKTISSFVTNVFEAVSPMFDEQQSVINDWSEESIANLMQLFKDLNLFEKKSSFMERVSFSVVKALTMKY